jgi:hypothetical protein
MKEISIVSARRLARRVSRLASQLPNTTKTTAKYEIRGDKSRNGEHSIKPNVKVAMARDLDKSQAAKPMLHNVMS